MRIEFEWLKQHTGASSRTCTLTLDQADILGEPWPLIEGWMKRSIGKVLTPEQVQRFELRLKINQREYTSNLDHLWG